MHYLIPVSWVADCIHIWIKTCCVGVLFFKIMGCGINYDFRNSNWSIETYQQICRYKQESSSLQELKEPWNKNSFMKWHDDHLKFYSRMENLSYLIAKASDQRHSSIWCPCFGIKTKLDYYLMSRDCNKTTMKCS